MTRQRKKIIIIGGGIVGMTAAYLLAKEKQDVLVIDAQKEGQATQAAAGIICPWLSQRRNKVWYELAKNGAAFYTELIPSLEKDTQMDSSYRRNGAVLLRDTPEKIENMYQLAKERREEAPEIGAIEKLSAEELAEKVPFLNEGYHGLFVSGGGRIEGEKLLEALSTGVEKFGGQIVYGEASLGNNRQVCVAGEVYTGDVVLLAVGAWLQPLLAPLNLSIDVLPQKGQLLVLQLLNTATSSWPVVLPPSAKSIVPFDQGRVIIGATHEKGKGFDLTPTSEAISEIQEGIAPFSETLANGKILEVRVGTRPYTSDFSPVIGALPGESSVFVANGLGASGLTVGPYAGKILADLAMGKDVLIDLTPYKI